MPTISPAVLPILMLFASNVFMTFAWYGHLKFKESWLPAVVLVSWGIAFFESEGEQPGRGIRHFVDRESGATSPLAHMLRPAVAGRYTPL